MTCRGETFHLEFSRIGELRSIVPPLVNMMALTATASNSLRRDVMRTLGMVRVSVVSVSPNRKNIQFIVKKIDSFECSFGPLIDEILNKEDSDRH